MPHPHFESAPVTLPVPMLAIANGVLFALGALLHLGVEIGAIAEPVSTGVATLELAGVALYSAALVGLVSAAPWARGLTRFANTFALVAVIAIAMLLGLDGERSAGFVKTLQVLRAVFAAVSLLVLFDSGRRGGIGQP